LKLRCARSRVSIKSMAWSVHPRVAVSAGQRGAA
jgi:hypothetical protein